MSGRKWGGAREGGREGGRGGGRTGVVGRDELLGDGQEVEVLIDTHKMSVRVSLFPFLPPSLPPSLPPYLQDDIEVKLQVPAHHCPEGGGLHHLGKGGREGGKRRG